MKRVDGLDGTCYQDPPEVLTLDELESGQYGEYYNYIERFSRWQYVLKTGWFYTGDIGGETGRRCGVLNRLDSVYMH